MAITYCAEDWIYEDRQYYVSKCSHKILGSQAESRHTLVSLQWKTQRARRFLSKIYLVSAEKNGRDSPEISGGSCLDLVGRSGESVGVWAAEVCRRGKFNVWRHFEVNLPLSECDRTWMNPLLNESLHWKRLIGTSADEWAQLRSCTRCVSACHTTVRRCLFKTFSTNSQQRSTIALAQRLSQSPLTRVCRLAFMPLAHRVSS